MRISDWSSDVCSSDLCLTDRWRSERAALRAEQARFKLACAGGVVRGVLAGPNPGAAPALSPTPPPIQYTAVGRWGGGEGRGRSSGRTPRGGVSDGAA